MKVLVIGAGKMGRAVAYDLARARDIKELRVADSDRGQLASLKDWLRSTKLKTSEVDAGDRTAVARLMKSCAVAVSCVPYQLNLGLTEAAIASRICFCDLGGNTETVQAQLALSPKAKDRGVTVVPDCGLAPGLMNVLAAYGVSRLDTTEKIEIRVGGLPREPKPPVNYRLAFSAHGLINEYSEPCLVLEDGRVATVKPLDGLEQIVFSPYNRLEAFNTSGGSSTLPHSFKGKVKTLNYKTIRYPGHCMQFRLLADLGLMGKKPVPVNGLRVSPRELVEQLLERQLGYEDQDLVLARIEVSGTVRAPGAPRTFRKPGSGPRTAEPELHVRKWRFQVIDFPDRKTGLTAMARMTGFPAAVAALMLGRGQIEKTGVVPGELAIPPEPFIKELRSRGVNFQFNAF